MQLNIPFRTILFHGLAWAAFIFYEVSMVLALSPRRATWWEYAGYYFLNILLFYVNAHVLLASAFRGNRAAYALLLLIPLEIGLYTLGEYGLELLLNRLRAEPTPVQLDKRFLMGCIWRGMYFVGLSTAYWFVRSTLRRNREISQIKLRQAEAEREKAELEKGLALAQNAFLRAQVNPHLLFNTLSFIYGKVEEVSPKAAEGVMLLSEVMHYALGQAHEDGSTELAREVEQVKKYIALNQLRFSKPLQLHTHFAGDFHRYRLPPLLLLTLVENIFKHGILNDSEDPATVSIACADDTLRLRARNRKRSSPPPGTGFGVGVRNVETRLRRFYEEGDFRLDIREDDAHYSTYFQIKLA